MTYNTVIYSTINLIYPMTYIKLPIYDIMGYLHMIYDVIYNKYDI